MKSIPQLIQAVYEWFILAPTQTRSSGSIERLCQQLMMTYLPGDHYTYGWNNLFAPLLRTGVIEICPGGYRLSPSCVVKGRKRTALINCPVPENRFDDNPEDQLYPGIHVVNDDALNQKRKDLPVVNMELFPLLSRFPRLQGIVDGWTSKTMVSLDQYFYFSVQGVWIKDYSATRVGIYTKSMESFYERVYMKPDYSCKQIPSFKANPDAFNIAAICSKLENKIGIDINYDCTAERIDIKNARFPLLLERTLFINSLVNSEIKTNLQNREYWLPAQAFSHLQRIFDYSIERI
jgi:hypothetical protein